MSKKQILEDVHISEREEILRDSCVFMEEMDFKREYSKEERDEMAHDFSEKFAKHQRLVLEVKEKIKSLKGEISESQMEIYTVSGRIQNGFEDVTEQVYFQDDQENNRMYIYDKTGRLIKDRALRPEERGKQLPMFETKTA